VLNSRVSALLHICALSRFTEHNDVIKSLLRWAPHLLGPALRTFNLNSEDQLAFQG